MSILHSSSPSNQDQFAFQSISKKSETSINATTVLEIMGNCDFIELTDTRDFDFAGSSDIAKKYIVLEFTLIGNAAHLNGLFNGMISLGNPKEVALSHQKDLNSYVLKYYASDEKIALAYFGKIINILEDEIRFKSILRKVIENLKSFDASQQLLRKELSH